MSILHDEFKPQKELCEIELRMSEIFKEFGCSNGDVMITCSAMIMMLFHHAYSIDKVGGANWYLDWRKQTERAWKIIMEQEDEQRDAGTTV